MNTKPCRKGHITGIEVLQDRWIATKTISHNLDFIQTTSKISDYDAAASASSIDAMQVTEPPYEGDGEIQEGPTVPTEMEGQHSAEAGEDISFLHPPDDTGIWDFTGQWIHQDDYPPAIDKW